MKQDSIDKDIHHSGYWEAEIAAKGVREVDNLLERKSGKMREAGDAAVRRHYESQALSAQVQRDEREVETLRLAQEATDLARKANRELRRTWAVGAIVAVALAVGQIVLR